MSSQVRIQPDSGAWSLAALQLADLAERGLAHLLGQLGRLDAGPVVVGALGLVLAELLADRGELLAEQELALALVHALAHVVLDLLGHVELGEVLARPLEHQRQARLDVGGLQQLALLLVAEVRRVAGHVGQLGGVGHPLDGVDDLPGVAPLQDRDHDPLVLLGQLADVVGDRADSSTVSASTQRAAPVPGTPEPMRTRSPARSTAARAPPGSRPTCSMVATTPWVGVAVREPRGEQQLAVGAGLGGLDDRASVPVELDGHDHAGQHDEVGDGQERQGEDVRHGFLDS